MMRSGSLIVKTYLWPQARGRLASDCAASKGRNAAKAVSYLKIANTGDQRGDWTERGIRVIWVCG